MRPDHRSEANGGDSPPNPKIHDPGMTYGPFPPPIGRLRSLDLTKLLARRNVWTLGLDGSLLYYSRGDWISFLFLFPSLPFLPSLPIDYSLCFSSFSVPPPIIGSASVV